MAEFPDGVAWTLQASGAALTFTADGLEARISEDTGHLQLAGPDLAGTPLADLVVLSSHVGDSRLMGDRPPRAECRRRLL